MSIKHTFTLIALAMIEAGRNIRKVPASDPEYDTLIHSIKNHGLLENLIIQPIDNKDGKYRIVAGHRRFTALRSLEKDGHLDNQHQVPCLIIDSNADAKELALAENTVRAAMHPADQVIIFRALVNDKRNTAVEIADRFGLSERTVNQRLRMANVHNDILNAYRRNEISQDAVMAFTLSSDKNEQKSLFDSLKKQSTRITGGWVRSKLTNHKINAGHRLVKFVGLKKYTDAGGETSTDLFADINDPTGIWINNPELIEQLAVQKLNTFAEKQDPRWSWTEAVLNHDYESQSKFRQVEAEPREPTEDEVKVIEELEALEDKLQEDMPDKEYDKLEKHHDTLCDKVSKINKDIYKDSTFRPEHYTNGGCIVSIDHNGKTSINKGLVKKEDWKNLTKDMKQAKKAENAEKSNTPGADEPKPLTYSNSLSEDLSYLRTTIVKTHLVNYPELALDLFTYQAAHDLLSNAYYWPKSVNINANATDNEPVTPPENDMHKRNNPCIAKFEELKKSLNLNFLAEKNENASFTMFQTLDKKEKTQILTTVIAASLNRQLSAEHENSYLRHATEIAVSQMDINWCKHMPLTSDFFFNRIPKQALYNIGDELFGPELWSKRYSGQRKRDLADMLSKHCDPDQASPELTPELKQKATAWTPIGFNPVPYKPKKPRAKRTKTKATNQADNKTQSAAVSDTGSSVDNADTEKSNGHMPPSADTGKNIPAFLNNIS